MTQTPEGRGYSLQVTIFHDLNHGTCDRKEHFMVFFFLKEDVKVIPVNFGCQVASCDTNRIYTLRSRDNFDRSLKSVRLWLTINKI